VAKKPQRRSIASALEEIGLASKRIIFVCGKGGVGKTTTAAATTSYLFQYATGYDTVVLMSTDPAHSISDSLGRKVGKGLTRIARREKTAFMAFSVDAADALAKFKLQNQELLHKIASRGTFLDDADINQLLDLSMPGMDEAMALLELSRNIPANEDWHIVVDTAPTGHTSRLLQMPAVFTHWLHALDILAEKHRYMVSRLALRPQVDEVQSFIRDFGWRIETATKMLHDSEHTAFVLVTNPQVMAVEETTRFFDFLRGRGIPVSHLIVNRVESELIDCKYCRARARAQQPILKRIERHFTGLQIRRLPRLAGEIRGDTALQAFGNLIWEPDGGSGAKGTNGPRRPLPKTAWQTGPVSIQPRELLIFGGKGGVGKTTSAVAASMALARLHPDSRILVFSTDPAHSLSDSLDERVGELKRGVAGISNLDAAEIDASARFEKLKARYQSWVDQVFSSLQGNSRWQIEFDQQAMRELFELAPPGIDEILSLAAVADLLARGEYATIVLDGAPSGHLIRFLELPGIALGWIRALLKLSLKYKNVFGSGDLGQELVALSRTVKTIIALMADPERCELIAVAQPETLSLKETVWLRDWLSKLDIGIRRVLINGVAPSQSAEHCDTCAHRLAEQLRIIRSFPRKLGPDVQILLAPQQIREVRGPERLLQHFEAWELIK
jgi:arsenite-transporting ATPase